MSITPFNVDGLAPAIGAYSHGVQATGTMMFLSGQVAMHPSGELVGTTAAEQTHQVLSNITHILRQRGCTLRDVVKATVFLTSMDDFQRVNAVYAEHFGSHAPARSAVAVAGLPRNALVEIEVIVCISEQ
jgi:2-iminobutanoate/2-iminopropanoate deaminase